MARTGTRRWRAAAPVLAVLLMAVPARAIDRNEQYLRVGYGIESCDAFVSAYGYHQVEEAGYANWLAGYVTAINKALPDTYDIKRDLDLHGVMDWVLGWCERREHQHKDVADAAAAFVKAQYPRRRLHK